MFLTGCICSNYNYPLYIVNRDTLIRKGIVVQKDSIDNSITIYRRNHNRYVSDIVNINITTPGDILVTKANIFDQRRRTLVFYDFENRYVKKIKLGIGRYYRTKFKLYNPK
jgi:hypothetical protein